MYVDNMAYIRPVKKTTFDNSWTKNLVVFWLLRFDSVWISKYSVSFNNKLSYEMGLMADLI